MPPRGEQAQLRARVHAELGQSYNHCELSSKSAAVLVRNSKFSLTPGQCSVWCRDVDTGHRQWPEVTSAWLAGLGLVEAD